jgi:hypothetical protein
MATSSAQQKGIAIKDSRPLFFIPFFIPFSILANERIWAFHGLILDRHNLAQALIGPNGAQTGSSRIVGATTLIQMPFRWAPAAAAILPVLRIASLVI